ncbi:MAG TPA: 16S rRNA (cytidine(1402)-2'-O)-methyltransferase, partial [Cryomorphaceae bacterium]|nr:16S rRNA (cytidine(1402)-2'-O)-methyltransferase [Cryomorphaceae bacterium]
MGKLILVPTPLGNLGDITLRALEVLKSADVVYAEDTRTTGKLLKLLDVQAPLRAFHMHNEHK